MKDDEKQCPYCAETIKKQAVLCRFCRSDVLRADQKIRRKMKEFHQPAAFRVSSMIETSYRPGRFGMIEWLTTFMVLLGLGYSILFCAYWSSDDPPEWLPTNQQVRDQPAPEDGK